jgi:hypothetical protein
LKNIKKNIMGGLPPTKKAMYAGNPHIYKITKQEEAHYILKI